MTKKPIIKIVNAETGEEIEREMNDLEYEQHLLDLADFQKDLEIKKQQDQAKINLLQRLGITEAEAKLLLS